MQTALLTSIIVLWVVVLFLVAAVVILIRQLGIIYERIAPVGALVVDHGPETGKPAPRIEVRAIDGRKLQIGGERARAQLLFVVSPTCPVCKKMLPIVKSLGAAERDWLEIVVTSDGEESALTRFHAALSLADIPFVISSALGRAFRVNRLPYALLIDRGGVLRAKGLINTREHLESLFTAMDLGVESLQQYASNAQESLHHVGS